MPDTMRRRVSTKLAIVTRQMRKHFDEAVSDLGVTRSQLSVIFVVASRPGATQRVIADHLEISEVSAGRLVDRLIAEGMVERKRKEDDKRAHAIFLTEKGEQLTGKLADAATISEGTAFAGIDDDALEQVVAVLETISTNLASYQ